MVRVVTVSVAGAAQATRRTVRRTWRCRCGAGRWARAGFALACLTIAGRAGGFSATWTAPPPTTAPPTVQAHSFARAIRTDITCIPFLAGGVGWRLIPVARSLAGVAMDEQMQSPVIGASALPVCRSVSGFPRRFRPIRVQLRARNEWRGRPARAGGAADSAPAGPIRDGPTAPGFVPPPYPCRILGPFE